MRRARYIRGSETDEFLQTLWETSITRQEVVEDGFLYRAQLGAEWEEQDHDGVVIDVPTPMDPDRMKPLSDRAREGRANFKGIPVIYLASELETAVAEVRPWVGAYVSVGTFRIARPLRIVNLDAGDAKGRMFHLQEPDAQERERAVWADVDRAFSTPVNPSDDLADYAPTQIVAELFRDRGLDGIGYRSALGDGHNVALFDIDSVELESCVLVDVTDVKFKIRMYGSGYTAEASSPENPNQS
jgi:hypothetical protein